MGDEEIVLNFKDAIKAMGDDREIYEEVLSVYLDSTPNFIRELQQALNDGDREGFKRCAHSIKSSSQTIGAMKIGTFGAGLEREALVIETGDAQKKIEQIREEYMKLLNALKDEGFTVE